MSEITREKVIHILSQIIVNGKNLVEDQIISSIIIKNDEIGYVIECAKVHNLDHKEINLYCTKLLKEYFPNAKILGVLTNEIIESPVEPNPARTTIKQKIEGVKKIILISSCKGGVGKSTFTVNLARKLAKENLRIGIVDADIYGPSIAKIFGTDNKVEILDGKMQPIITEDNIQTMSIGYLVPEPSALIWRGPMVSKNLFKLLRATNWNDVDILLIDMPPGTGDVLLSIAENYPIHSSILISTPQDLAVSELKKTIDSFKKLEIEIIGIVENMSYYAESSGERKYIFGREGAKKLAAEEHIDFLGEIPITENLKPYAKAIATRIKAILESK